jgi:hypothetical protein
VALLRVDNAVSTSRLGLEKRSVCLSYHSIQKLHRRFGIRAGHCGHTNTCRNSSGRGEKILKKRAQIKRKTIQQRRLLYQTQAA